MKIQLIHGDCLVEMQGIPDKSIDMVLCDLPYGTTANKWDSVIPLDELWAQYKRIVKRGGAIVLFGAEPFSSFLRLSNLDWYRYDWKWDKIRGYNFQQANFAPMRNYEDVMVFCEYPAIYNADRPTCPYHPQKTDTHIKHTSGSPSVLTENLHNWNCKPMKTEHFGYYPNAIIQFAKEAESLHPTQKPVDLLRYLVLTYTNEGDTVLDNCIGSGSTGVACVNTKRNFIGIELNEEYFKIAEKRIKEAQQQLTHFNLVVSNKVITFALGKGVRAGRSCSIPKLSLSVLS